MYSPVQPQETISVLVAESSMMGAQLIAAALKRCRNNFTILGPTCNSDDAVQIAEKSAPQVAVISTELQDGPLSGFKVLQKIRTSGLRTAAVMLTDKSESEVVIDSFCGGARGVFSRRGSLRSLAKCIRAVHSGQLWISNEQLEYLLQLIMRVKPLQQRPSGPVKPLTKREEEVVHLVAEGMRNSEIAREMHVTEHTIRNYLFRIFEKIGLSNRVELILYLYSRTSSEPLARLK